MRVVVLRIQLVLLAMFPASGDAQIEPVAEYRFDDGVVGDGTLARNASVGGSKVPNAVYRGAVKLVAGPAGLGGRAASFGGADIVEIPHSGIFAGSELTVEFWFRSTQVFDRAYWPGSATLVTKATAGDGSGDWCILGGSLQAGVNEGRIMVGCGPKGGSDIVLASGKGLNDGRFHHVVWTRAAGGKNTLQVDGLVCATAQDSGAEIENGRAIHIGGDKLEQGGRFFRGEMAALSIYNTALPEETIRARFATGIIDPRLPSPAAVTVDFAKDIKPILRDACFKCHGPEKEKGGLFLATRARAMEGGDEGVGIIPGDSAASPLVHRIAALDEDSAMPPEGERLSREQVGLIRAWIDQGAVWPQGADELDPRLAKVESHWSFQPLLRPPVPKREDAWITSPVDAFILEKLHAAKLSPASPADKEALLRRVSFDLTGLPPSPEQIAAFAADTSKDAFAVVVDRLLTSPAHGERWARHWLDVVRYSDSGGYETDIFYEQAWRFRDYVIRSFNGDKPFDRFLMEQVAGDELWPGQAEMGDAVAVWTLGEWQNALDAFPDMLEYVRRTDQVSMLGEAALGLTVGCANCHNHKFDPITQRDYFGLEAIFAASETWNRNTGAKAWGKGERTAFRAVRHAERPLPIHLLTRGELTKPTRLIAPALPAFLPGGGPLPGAPDEAKQRRARLARWLVSPENPLTARVIANRIWQWHFGQALVTTPNDFGTQGAPPSHPELLDWLASELRENGWSMKGLHRKILLSSAYRQSAVRGARAIAEDPQNRWLAGFPRRRLEAEEVWDHLHAAAGTLDLKGFGPPFVPKLAPEELQGMYDLENKPELKWPVTPEQNRRGIYILNRRSFRFPFFEAFDPPNTASSCPVRQTTTVPTQALTLLNNHTVGEQARAMALRLMREAGDSVESIVKRAWLLAYSRAASEGEWKLGLQFIARAEAEHVKSGTPDARAAALVEFCMGVMNTTEFIYTN
jgi:mono/diheme cytochrome c family protein